MYYVYVIQSKNEKWRYIGMTKDIDRRFHEHDNGYVKATRKRRPFTMIYLERVLTRPEARVREKWLKSGWGREHIENCVHSEVAQR